MHNFFLVIFFLFTLFSCTPSEKSAPSVQEKQMQLLTGSILLSSFAPASGNTGIEVTIKGSNIAKVTGVKFNGISAVKFWGWGDGANDVVQAVVPSNATSGKITVITAAGSASSSSNFSVNGNPEPPPSNGIILSSFSPSSSDIGAEITIKGAGIAKVTGVKFNGVAAVRFWGWGDGITDVVQAIVPANATSGKITIITAAGSGVSNSNFTVNGSTPVPPTEPPTEPPANGMSIASFTPATGNIGQEITLKGKGIAKVVSVKFNNVASTRFWGWGDGTNDVVQAIVPSNATSGKITITTSVGSVSTLSNFTVNGTVPNNPPSISDFNPKAGAVGSSVVISGNNFLSDSVVKFNGVSATISSLSSSSLTVVVPSGASSGLINVMTSKGSVNSSTSFSVSTIVNPKGPQVIFPKNAITANEIAIVINENDPISVQVGNYYQQVRNIPSSNIVKIRIGTGSDITASELAAARAIVNNSLSSEIQGLVLTWTRPFRVERCMSITSAFTFGYSESYCRKNVEQTGACGTTANSPYYGNDSVKRPFSELGLRPTMALAGTSLESIKRYIDRSVQAEKTFPSGTAYMRTSDPNRGVRSTQYNNLVRDWNFSGTNVKMDYVATSNGSSSAYITGKSDVLFYSQGMTVVPGITQNQYVKGALADHLTSWGGVPDNLQSWQMSAIYWLDAGASASYGTVVEPCAYWQKFSNMELLTNYYFRGATALEAYWKSVQMPGEGIFIGDPLTRPFGEKFTYSNGVLTISTTTLKPGDVYMVQSASSSAGPFSTVVDNISVPNAQMKNIVIQNASAPYYRLIKR